MNDSFGSYYCDYFWEMIQFIIIFSITCFHFFRRDKLDFGSLILFQIMVSIFGFTPCGLIDGTSCMQHQYELLHVSICAWIGQSPEDKFAYLMILPLK